MDPTRRRAYVASSTELYRLELSPLAHRATVALPAAPHAVSVIPALGKVYVLSASEVTVVRTSDDSVIASLSVSSGRTFAVNRASGRLVFTVRDGGPGMDAKTLARAGEPFYTTKPLGKGTGLGLHLVRLVAERLGGEFDLASEPQAGTVAQLVFPESRLEVNP